MGYTCKQMFLFLAAKTEKLLRNWCIVVGICVIVNLGWLLEMISCWWPLTFTSMLVFLDWVILTWRPYKTLSCHVGNVMACLLEDCTVHRRTFWAQPSLAYPCIGPAEPIAIPEKLSPTWPMFSWAQPCPIGWRVKTVPAWPTWPSSAYLKMA